MARDVGAALAFSAAAGLAGPRTVHLGRSAKPL